MSAVLGYPCTVCRRASEAITINSPNGFAHLCSTECGVIYMTKKPVRPDEKTAALIGGNAGGSYLESIGVFDLRQLTSEQWGEFCGKIFQGTCEELARRADDEIPF